MTAQRLIVTDRAERGRAGLAAVARDSARNPIHATRNRRICLCPDRTVGRMNPDP